MRAVSILLRLIDVTILQAGYSHISNDTRLQESPSKERIQRKWMPLSFQSEHPDL